MSYRQTPNNDSVLSRILRDYDEADADFDALAEMVHDAKAAEASAITNSGLAEQIAYLLDEGYTEDDIRNALGEPE